MSDRHPMRSFTRSKDHNPTALEFPLSCCACSFRPQFQQECSKEIGLGQPATDREEAEPTRPGDKALLCRRLGHSQLYYNRLTLPGPHLGGC
ncbi:hypothetical protein CSUI_000177 [Cystoisospora suis]|uniref:Uncharacterized protein n=1 Tax=Cystoisospora suis TaxID=483139 RepID=A0A2C6LGU9_9APIC|nr:hypothetical protein CSUI_000177 [Cystoisospora suis]